MKIFKQDAVQHLTSVNYYKKKLRSEYVVTVKSLDHLEHISAYLAWAEVGGNIFVKSPLLPTLQAAHVDEEIKNLTLENNVVFHTSGTTGSPKLVVQSKQEISRVQMLSSKHLGWHTNTKFLNYVPAMTSGFWHIILPSLVHHDCSIVLGSRETIPNDFKQGCNLSVFVPGLIDQLRIRKISPDLQIFEQILCGASQVLPRHAQYCFDNNCQVFNHIYGATEIGSPVLSHKSFEMNKYVNYLELSDMCSIENNELVYNGHRTGDLFEQDGNLIKFIGRTNDLVKINGYQCSLLLIENIIEDLFNINECLAVPRNRAGSDYIELLYVANILDKELVTKVLERRVPAYNIPKKYTKVTEIPKNELGKKLRNAF